MLEDSATDPGYIVCTLALHRNVAAQTLAHAFDKGPAARQGGQLLGKGGQLAEGL
jgi:hypothetical protein